MSLQIKSESAISTSKNQAAPHAVLCTQDHTFQLRQVQSSNTLYVLQASESKAGEGSELAAIAQCGGLLELIPHTADVLHYLRKAIPVYNDLEDSSSPTDGTSVSSVQLDAPFSEEELLQGFTELCVFEEKGKCWIPSAKALRDTWSAFFNLATATGINISKEFDVGGVRRTVAEEGARHSIFDSIMLRNSATGSTTGTISLDMERCISWVGRTILDALEGASTSRVQFMTQWQDSLPEAWGNNIKIDLLQVRLRNTTAFPR